MGIATEAQKRATKKYLQNRHRVSIDLEPDVYDAINQLACERSVSITAVIRSAIMYEILPLLEDD